MVQRCTNPNRPYWKDYGGRGIKVCERWHKFENFLEDMGDKPGPKHSLDRFPDNNGNYEPGNVRWATIQEQSENKTNTLYLTYNGKTQAASAWARELSIPKTTIYSRVRRGLPVCEVLQKS